MNTDRMCSRFRRVLVVALTILATAIWPHDAIAASGDPSRGDVVDAPPAPIVAAGGARAEVTPYTPPRALPGAVGYLRDANGLLCTATVVASRTGSVAATAGHCVFLPQRAASRAPGSAPGWKSGLTFTPGTDLTSAPFGTWQVDRVQAHPEWVANARRGADIAFVHLQPRNGRTVQEVVGAHVLSRAPDVENDLTYTAVGFPREGSYRANLRAQECSSRWNDLDGGGDSAGGFFMMPCDMTGGASGGPWLTKVSEPGSGVGALVAVTTASGPDLVHRRPGVTMLHGVVVTVEVLGLYTRIDV